MKAKSIKVNWESWFYLHQEEHKQRSETGKPISEKTVEKLKRNFYNFADKNGMKTILSGDFGGCIGNPINGWEERRWTSWTLDEMKKMLDEKGLKWEESEDKEILPVYI